MCVVCCAAYFLVGMLIYYSKQVTRRVLKLERVSFSSAESLRISRITSILVSTFSRDAERKVGEKKRAREPYMTGRGTL